MINSVNFMGREGYLTTPAKNTEKKVANYVAESSILPKLNTKTQVIDNEANYTAKLNEAYKAAHAPYLEEKPLAEESSVVMDGQLL